MIPVARVKSHTDFRGRVESGLLKMSAIGLGKHAQALALHSLGVEGIRDHMIDAGQHVARSGHLLFGLAIVENAYDEPAIQVPPPAVRVRMTFASTAALSSGRISGQRRFSSFGTHGAPP